MDVPGAFGDKISWPTLRALNSTTGHDDTAINIPDRYEQFVLQDGEKKIEEEIDNRTPSTSIFTLNKEDHTLANLIRDKLLRHPHVTFAAYKVPHPLFAKVELRVQTDGDCTPKDALRSACSELIKEIDVFRGRFRQAYELTKMSKGQNGGNDAGGDLGGSTGI